jgi:ABC-2 type transport system permease protein
MRLPRLFMAIFSISLRRGLAHRTDLLFESLVHGTEVAAGLAALGILYTRTDTLGGVSRGEAVVLLGTYQLVSGVLWTFIEPNVAWFRDQIIDGKLDDTLLKPVPSMFLASLGTCAPLGLSQAATGMAVVVIGLRDVGTVPNAWGIVAWLLTLGVVLTWAWRVLLASLAFWAPSFQPEVLFKALWQFGRYPVGLYRQPVRFSLTYVLPIAFIATIPAQALTQRVSPRMMLAGGAFGIAAFLIVHVVWQAGLRRYTSATS